MQIAQDKLRARNSREKFIDSLNIHRDVSQPNFDPAQLSFHNKAQVGQIRGMGDEYTWLNSKKTIYIQDKIREIKMKVDYDRFLTDYEPSIRR